MSISISIGSSSEDIQNLQNTKLYLSFIKTLFPDPNSTIEFNDTKLNTEDLDSLITWYNVIVNILLTGGSSTDLGDIYSTIEL